MNPYANLQFQNPANALMQGFQQGGQMRREGETRNALSQFAQNPNDPKAMQALAKYNPEMAIQLQERQRQEQMRGLEAHRENIVKGAQIFRQLGVKDQASYEQALGIARQMGIDVREVPPQFDPQYVNGVVQIAETFAPQKETQDPSMIREYEIAKQRGHIPQGMDFQQFLAVRNPGMMSPVVIPQNAYVETPGGGGAPQGGQPARPADKAQYDALPPGTQYMAPDGTIRVKQGGQSGAPAGNFP